MKPITKAWLCAAGVLALPGMAGCGGADTAATAPAGPAPQPRSVSAALPDGLTATLAEDRATVAVGGVVTYTLTLANGTAQPITYQPILGGVGPSGGVPASLLVLDPRGRTAFPLGALPSVVAVGPNITLAPGQLVSGTIAVGSSNRGGYSAAGRYTASAAFTVQTGQSGASPSATAVGPLEVDAQ